MKKTRSLYSLAIFLGLIIPSVTFAFDCNKISNRIELLICTTPDIIKLDQEMLALQQQIIVNKMSIIPAQSEWRRQRNACKDVSCLRACYYSRIVFFKTQLTSLATPSENSNPPLLTSPEVSTSDVTAQATPPYIGPTERMSDTLVQTQNTTNTSNSRKNIDLTPETIPAPFPEKPPLITGKGLRSFIIWIVFLTALLGIFKAFSSPVIKSFLKSYFTNLRVELEKSKSVIPRDYSPRYSWLILVPLLLLTGWLTYNVSIFLTAVIDMSFFSTDCLPPSISSYDYAGWQNASANYYAQHPECAPGNQENRGLNVIEQRGFLIAYDVWALLAMLYLSINLLRNTPVTRHNLLPFCLVVSIMVSRVTLGFVWPYLGFLSPSVPTILTGLFWAIPIPLIVLVLLLPLSIIGSLGLIFSAISMILLPIVVLFNQIHIFLLARQKQEIQTSGIYVWLAQIKYWFSTMAKSPSTPDEIIAASFSAQERNDTMNAAPLSTLKTEEAQSTDDIVVL